MTAERFNPDMLRLAREVREATQADLAQWTGVTQALVSKVENGLINQPSEEIVQKVAAALKFPPSFFYQAERAIGLPHFHYRLRSRLGAKPLAHISAIINIRRQHIAKLMRSYEIQVLKPIPQIDLDESGLTPERVAERLRAYWMLPRGPVENVVDVVEQAGGIVILCRFGTDLLDGMSFRSEGLPPLFFMNKDVPGDRFRFSLAHELGHIVLHSIPDEDQKIESEATRFASAFLMPTTDVRPYLADAKITNFARVKTFWKVPIRRLIDRAYDLKLVTDSQYKSLNSQYNKSFKDREPVEISQEQPSRLKQIVRYHIEKLGYSVADLANFLCLNEDDVKRAYLDRPRLELVRSN